MCTTMLPLSPCSPPLRNRLEQAVSHHRVEREKRACDAALLGPRLLLLVLVQGKQRDTGDLDHFEADTGDVTHGVTAAAETRDEHLVLREKTRRREGHQGVSKKSRDKKAFVQQEFRRCGTITLNWCNTHASTHQRVKGKQANGTCSKTEIRKGRGGARCLQTRVGTNG